MGTGSCPGCRHASFFLRGDPLDDGSREADRAAKGMNYSGGAISARYVGVFGSFQLDVTFDAPMLGITALFGPSGCGKTTILRCVAGLNRLPGRLVVDGELWQDHESGRFREPYLRPVGYVFQEASLFPHLSVRGNLLYGRRRAL